MKGGEVRTISTTNELEKSTVPSFTNFFTMKEVLR